MPVMHRTGYEDIHYMQTSFKGRDRRPGHATPCGPSTSPMHHLWCHLPRSLWGSAPQRATQPVPMAPSSISFLLFRGWSLLHRWHLFHGRPFLFSSSSVLFSDVIQHSKYYHIYIKIYTHMNHGRRGSCRHSCRRIWPVPRGGDVAVRKGKDVHKKYQREQKRF